MNLIEVLLFAVATAASPLLRRMDTLPSFVVDYAPILHLYSQETYLPSDIGSQLVYTIPEVNFTQITSQTQTLDNLSQLNELGGTAVYLTSKEGIQALPSWFNGVRPNPSGIVSGAKTGTVVVVDKPQVDGGVVDVFYFYFYAYNQGDSVRVLGVDFGQFGDHVGDWEHNMIRFKNGEPQAVWFSQHAFGQAFTYDAVEKKGLRPTVYVGNGTHANYATPGLHDHTLQIINLPDNEILTDYTDAGPWYDSTASSYFNQYDTSTQVFSPYDSSPVNWLNFTGQWGDQQLPKGSPGQEILFGFAKYSDGPSGPRFKDLDRIHVCPDKINPCIVSPVLLS